MAKILIPGADITDHVNDNGHLKRFNFEQGFVSFEWEAAHHPEDVEFEIDQIKDLELEFPEFVDREDFHTLGLRYEQLEDKLLKAEAELRGQAHRLQEQAQTIIKQGKQLLKQNKPWWRFW